MLFFVAVCVALAVNHHSLIADYSVRIFEACLAAADSCLPHTCHRCPRTGLPGWTEFVAPIYFLACLWIDCGKPRDFWSETKRMRRKSMVSSNVVDGCCTAESISDYFANKYKELYSSVAHNYQEMSEVQEEINHLIYNSGFNTNCIITSDDIASGVKKLPR